jgi:copper chaperone
VAMTRNFEVPGVTCDHCKRAIEGEVGQLEGITEVVVDIDKTLVTVDGIAADEAIVTAINEAGYEVAGRGIAGGPDEATGPPNFSGPLP